jgi:hypothetical protein
MACWGLVVALTGFSFDVRTGVISFAGSDARQVVLVGARLMGDPPAVGGRPAPAGRASRKPRITALRVGERDYPGLA